jgi:amino acid adenylation domain-containing protein
MPAGFLDRPVFDIFRETAEQWGGRMAIRCRNGVTRYDALLERAQRIGVALEELGTMEGAVGIALPVDHRFPAGMLGALGAGRAYVPLDLSQPADRLRYMVGHAGLGCVLVCRETVAAVSEVLPAGCRILDVDQLPGVPSGWQGAGEPGDVAYVLYTSGSTGRPKGVFQDQRGLMHDVGQYTNSVHFSETDVTSLLYSPGVNGAIRDIYGALLNGGCLCMTDLRGEGFAAAAARMADAGLTLFHAMPPVLRSLLRELGDHAMMSRVRLAYVAGDRFWGSDLKLLRGALPRGAHLYTGIGSTECATLYRQWFVPEDWPAGEGVIPVGYPVENRTVQLREEGGAEVAPGEPGLICVRGRHLARGYWRDEALTASVFERNPLEPERVTFRTGDRGRMRSDGLLEFLGRGDRQVKVRGYRVELLEVESALRAVDGVDEAAVVQDGIGDACQLVGFVQTTAGEEGDEARIVGVLEKRLPAYMRPARVVCLAQLPRLGNGKPDWVGMRGIAAGLGRELEGRWSAGRAVWKGGDGDGIEKRVWEEWARVLGTQGAGMGLSWGRSGGDSLKALELTVALEREFGIRLPVGMLDVEVTPARLSARVREVMEAVKGGGKVPASLGHFFIVPWAPGASVHDRRVAEVLGTRFQVEVLTLTSLEEELERVSSIPDLAARCVERISRTTDPGTRVYLMGMSYGGRVAVELSAQLRSKGYTVAMLGVGDIASDSGYDALSRRAWAAWADSAGGNSGWRRWWRRCQAWMRIAMGGWIRGVARLRWQRLLRLTVRVGMALFGGGFRGGALAAIRRSQVSLWKIPHHAGELVLFVTEETSQLLGGLGPRLGWERHADVVRVIRVEGHHTNYFGPEFGTGFAERLLDAATESLGQSEQKGCRSRERDSAVNTTGSE